MKKYFGLPGCLLVLTYIISACSSPPPPTPVDITTYRDLNGKPIKKIPLQNGSFEVTQGAALVFPIDMNLFHQTALSAFASLGYRIEKDEEGSILVRLVKSGWWLQLRLCYWDDEYWYEYVDSKNLNANPAKNRIHKNYYRWIANLEKNISQFYLNSPGMRQFR
ncbi:MAG: hypothetical protein LBT33_01575 [Spirochaetia bacterium]|jgi:hypothetical protein|nr:hypothetical protein [Spirochaetia bacterium]